MNEMEQHPENKSDDILPDIDNEVFDKEVDDIIEFYRDMPDESSETNADEKDNGRLSKALRLISKPFRRQRDKSHIDNSEELHETVYGLGRKSKTIVTYVTTFFICAAIIAGSYGLALIIPGNEAETEKNAVILREKNDYTELKLEHDRVIVETEQKRDAVAQKKDQAVNITNIDNTKSELHAEIAQKTGELDSLNAEYNRLNEEIAAVDAQIQANSGLVAKSLPPGRYTVGKDIAPGKYSVVGSGAFSVATSSGDSKLNTTLGSSPVDVELASGYKLKLNGTVKFTPTI